MNTLRMLMVAIAMTVCTAPVTVAEQKQKSDERDAVRQVERRAPQAAIGELISRLKNKNRAPTKFTGRPPVAVFPEDYDWAEQAKVIDAWKALDQRASEALTKLPAHFDDTEYCVTYGGFDGKWSNHTVGEICRLIVTSNVVPCVFTTDHPPVPWTDEKASLRKWLSDRSGMPLKALQLETMASAVKFYEKQPPDEYGHYERYGTDDDPDVIIHLIKGAGDPVPGVIFRGGYFNDHLDFKNCPWPRRSIKELISKLVSMNHPIAKISRSPEKPAFPKDYDYDDQDRVIAAFQELDDRIDEAWPELIKHFDDKEYSVTQGGPVGTWANLTVGNVAHKLVTENLLPFICIPFPRPPWGNDEDPWGNDENQRLRWFSARAGQPMARLQAEALTQCRDYFASLDSDRFDEAGTKESVMRRLDKLIVKIKTTGRRERSALFAPDWYHFASRPREQ